MRRRTPRFRTHAPLLENAIAGHGTQRTAREASRNDLS